MSRTIRALFFCSILSTVLTAVASAQPPASSDLGTIAVRVRPSSADVLIDGERWVSSENDGRILVQLPEGRHAVEIRAGGYVPFSTVIDVRRGETTPVNVSLSTTATAPPAAPSPGRAPMAPQAEDNGFMIAPDYRIGELQHRTAQFAGVYGGRVFDGRLMIGAGAYWQTNPNVTHMVYGGPVVVYGGPVVEWRVWTDRAIGFTAHGLAGYGQARMDRRFVLDNRTVDGRMLDAFGNMGMMGDQGFFIAEPEAQIVARFGSKVHLHAGVGYRVTSAHDGMGLNGVSGSVSIQFGR